METTNGILPHNDHDYYAHGDSSHGQPPNPQGRRRRRHPGSVGRGSYGGGGNLRMCPHCGRTFKRTEHLERHVRTHTKEKPFVCHCSAAFARRDLLTRHQRLNSHEDDSPAAADSTPSADADLAAAVSLSGLSTDPWASHQHQPQHGLPHMEMAMSDPVDQSQISNVTGQTYTQDITSSSQLFDATGGAASADTPDVTSHILGDALGFDPHFREFANFLDGVGLPAEWSPYFNGPPERDNEGIDPDLRQSPDEPLSPRLGSGSRQRPGTPFSSWLPSAPTGNTLSNNASDSHPRSVDPEAQRFKVTDDQRAKLNSTLESYSHIVDNTFKLPSRHALSRYITSWFEGFHSHMPFIHCRTWHILEHPLELILGIAAVGAQYCFEHRSSERLFYAGKAILMEKLVTRSSHLGPRTSSSLALNSPSVRSGPSDAETKLLDPVETIRTLIALMGYATWEPNASMVREAFALQGLLAQVLRDIGLDDEDQQAQPTTSTDPSNRDQDGHTAWLEWINQESCRRSKLIAFSFLHTHSIAYNVYPVLRSNEVNLRLPCPTKEWKAPTAVLWQGATGEAKKPQLYFQDALSLLLRNSHSGNNSAPLDPIPTPLGNYVLLHGLLQRIHIVRDLSLPVMSNSAELPAEEVMKLEHGLRSWTSGWQQAAESSLDPNNENGPIPFTSSSLLALAYVRIHLHLGPFRHLETRDPARIAKAIAQSPDIERSDGVIAALLYAVHMLSIPVRLGVDRVARSQAFFWSVRHSLASLECSILLSKWLRKLGDTVAVTPLSDSEDRIIHWVRSIVEEAFSVVDFDNDEGDCPDFRDPGKLGIAVLRIWAHFFTSNTQWPFINIIGRGLEQYRQDLIKQRR